MNRTKIHLLPATLCLCAAWLVCTTTACDDRIETDAALPGDGETIEVNVRLGFAPEENAAAAATDTRTYTGKAKGQAFSVELQAEANTRETTTEITTPDKLYGLNYFLYSNDGKSLLAYGYQQNAAIGSALNFTVTSTAVTQYDDCQLVIIARGTAENSAISEDNANTLAALQAISFDRNVIDAIPTSGATSEQMNKMPYVLHLKHVRLVKEGDAWKLQSPDVNTTGAQDVRLMLKRLAAKVTVNWNYDVTVNNEQYTLKQLLLQSVPRKFNYIPTPNEGDGSYPGEMDQYIALTATVDAPDELGTQKGTYSFWVPANVRADNPAVSSELLRTKDNAPSCSSFMEFEAVNSNPDNKNKKFRYRIYTGDDNPQNFSIKQNTDYIYNIKFAHTDIPVQDRRVTYVDPIPASQNNDNFVPTANCFMVKPGGSFCFDPFLFRRVESGVEKDVENTVLTGWTKGTRGGIRYVKVVWQTRENGDTGDPVLGIANSGSDHTNIVELVGTNNAPLPTNGYTQPGDCRIYCRVAPNTIGGNGLTAAYDANDKILWSWHLWVTDYNPDSRGGTSVDTPNKRKQKYSRFSSKNYPPMMDRNIGAQKGFVDYPEGNELERSRADGLGYSYGRKDPTLGSFSKEKRNKITITEGAVDGLLNMYAPDGYSVISRDVTASSAQSVEWTFLNILKWGYSQSSAWNGDVKTFYDPSPQGWRVPPREVMVNFFDYENSSQESKSSREEEASKNGGLLMKYGTNDTDVTYVRLTGYRRSYNTFEFINQFTALWARDTGNDNNTAWAFAIDYIKANDESGKPYPLIFKLVNNWQRGDAHQVRCIQEIE
ncbi:MAG: DUF4906 domain-containing protein [Bacteroides sp.]|nr:DUF4906 domain-containing protein [Bacteroides sp.]